MPKNFLKEVKEGQHFSEVTVEEPQAAEVALVESVLVVKADVGCPGRFGYKSEFVVEPGLGVELELGVQQEVEPDIMEVLLAVVGTELVVELAVVGIEVE